jgi:hypothetical protein
MKVTLPANCGAIVETKKAIAVNVLPAGLPGFLIIKGHGPPFAPTGYPLPYRLPF